MKNYKLLFRESGVITMSIIAFVFCYFMDKYYCVEYGGRFTAFHYGIYMFGFASFVFIIANIFYYSENRIKNGIKK